MPTATRRNADIRIVRLAFYILHFAAARVVRLARPRWAVGRLRSLVFAACVAAAAVVSAAFPPPQKYVSDGARVIRPEIRDSINAMLKSVESDTGAEIAVVTVESLDGMTVEDYGVRLFKAWGIGKKGADNGILVLVAPGERKMRIEVGYGLEPIVPDGLAGQIIREEFTPQFKNGDYGTGIRSGVTRLADIVRARHVVTPEERKRYADAAASADRPPTLLMTPFFGAFVGIGAFMIGAGLASKTGFPLLFGSIFGGIPFLMAMVPFFNAARPWLILAALVAGVLGYRRGGSAFATATSSRRGRGRHGAAAAGGSGWTWGVGGSSGSGSSSSSSSSSGSFGGGSSGGGGASGSW